MYAVVSDSVSRGDPAGITVDVALDQDMEPYVDMHVDVGAGEARLRVVGGPSEPAGVLLDMVEALGGRLGHADGVLTVVLPCAS